MENTEDKDVKVAIADDHKLIRKGIVALVNSFPGFQIIYEADNGEELIKKIQNGPVPEIVLMDLNMPVMDGFAASEWISVHQEATKIIILTVNEAEYTLFNLMKLGIKGFLRKSADLEEFENALRIVSTAGMYFPTDNPRKRGSGKESGKESSDKAKIESLTEKEIEFIKLSCSNLKYKEVAEKMFIGHRTVDNYRDAVYEKLNVNSRAALIMFAVRNGLINFT
jgi:two-component system, NarL family, invasion response regulator UvrY